MNCNWTNESRETLIPLIDKAAELEVELFCLDNGWQQRLGVWYKNEKLDVDFLGGKMARLFILTK